MTLIEIRPSIIVRRNGSALHAGLAAESSVETGVSKLNRLKTSRDSRCGSELALPAPPEMLRRRRHVRVYHRRQIQSDKLRKQQPAHDDESERLPCFATGAVTE